MNVLDPLQIHCFNHQPIVTAATIMQCMVKASTASVLCGCMLG